MLSAFRKNILTRLKARQDKNYTGLITGIIMSVRVELQEDKNQLTLKLSGQFNFSMYNEFRDAYSDEKYKKYNITIDMQDCSMVDSSALGMLLIMKKYMDKGDGEITISNSNEEVMKVLQIVHFEKKFTIK
jgi:anti-anti-sigma factor